MITKAEFIGVALGLSLITSAVLLIQSKISALELVNKDLQEQVSTLETNLETERLLRAQTENENKLLISKESSDKIVEVEKKVYVDKVRDPKVSTAEQINLLTDELESQWSNLQQ